MIIVLLASVLMGYIYEDSDSLIVINDSLTICGYHQYAIKVHVTNHGKLNIRQCTGAGDSTGFLILNAPLIMFQDSSLINGSGLGYKGGYMNSHPNGYGPGGGGAGGVSGGAGGGGGYGGNGGAGGDMYPGAGGSAYGDSHDTLIDIGSGGGTGRLSVVDGWGGNGGAELYLRGFKIVIDTSYIQTNGQNGSDGGWEAGGGGSGGGIMVWADSIIMNDAALYANGGDGGNQMYGGGGGGGAGGGRIKLFYYSSLDTLNLVLLAQGGSGGPGGSGNGEAGMPGSIYIEHIVSITEIADLRGKKLFSYSNPTREVVKIISDEVPITLQLYDVSGRRVKTFTINKKINRVDLKELDPGVYFLKSPGYQESVGKLILLK
jgi:hypothetical protein